MTVDHPATRPRRPADRPGGPLTRVVGSHAPPPRAAPRPLPPARRLGAGAHDQQHRLEVLAPISAPDGLGVVAEYRAAVGLSDRPLKMTLPGPFTLSGRLRTGPGEVYADRVAAAEAFVPLLRAEVVALADAGARVIQVDEPSPAIHPDAGADFAALFNAVIEPVVGRVRLGAHLCFGHYLGRPPARGTCRTTGA